MKLDKNDWTRHNLRSEGRAEYRAFVQGKWLIVTGRYPRQWCFVVQDAVAGTELHVSRMYPTARIAKAEAEVWLTAQQKL